ncbi:MAG: COX15/CtaA family protein [Bdellovibrionales bacterium]
MTRQTPDPSNSLIGTSRFSKWIWALVIYTVFVIIWGAWVRISHSGDGCGQHWPLCEGAFIPQQAAGKTWIEYLHRLTSGLYGIFVAALMIQALRLFPRGSTQRVAAILTFILMIIEAALGAALVLKGLVGENATLYRLFVMTFHQINSLLLVGSTVVWAHLTAGPVFPWTELKGQLRAFSPLALFVLIPATGAWAALANTLFPSLNLTEGLQKDFAPDSPWILRLRVAHPLLALSLGVILALHFYRIALQTSDSAVRQAALRVSAVFAGALIFGILTLVSLSPVWMKLVHLTWAQVLWISLVSYAITSLLSTRR